MEMGLYAVAKKGLSGRCASALFGIPKSSFSRAVIAIKEGREVGKIGAPTLLSLKSEQVLQAWIVNSSPSEFPTRDEIISHAEKLAYTEGNGTHEISHSWCQSYLRRHPTLKTIYPDPIEEVRIIPQALLEDWFVEYDWVRFVIPGLLWNFDESMIAPSKRRFQVVVPSL
jgi:hypothetical protein